MTNTNFTLLMRYRRVLAAVKTLYHDGRIDMAEAVVFEARAGIGLRTAIAEHEARGYAA